MILYNPNEFVTKNRLAELINEFVLQHGTDGQDVANVAKDELGTHAAERAIAWVAYLGQVSNEVKDGETCQACQRVLAQTVSILSGGGPEEVTEIYDIAVEKMTRLINEAKKIKEEGK